MMSMTRGDIKAAIKSVRRNKWRSLLTMLGVIIGVASVVTVVSIGEGVKHQVSEATNRLGKDLIMIRPGRLVEPSRVSSVSELSRLMAASTGGSLSSKDVGTVSKTSGASMAAPLSLVATDTVSDGGTRKYPAVVIGTTESLPMILKQRVAYGAFFSNDSSDANKVVIGKHIATALYDEDAPLGHTLNILGRSFIVAGVFDDFRTAPLSSDVDFNDAVFIQYSAALDITNSDSPMYEILVRPQRVDQTDAVAAQLQTNLIEAHGGQRDVTVLKQTQALAVTQGILNLLTALVAGLAAISLLVGGIGIMNVMLVSITERMHEIGIRKAIGATNGQILSQFVIEAAALSMSGGVAGVLLAFVADGLLRLYTNFEPVMSWQIVVLACLVSMGVGVLFGSIPAWQAARKDPITALRNE